MNHLKLLRSISGNNVAVVVQNTQKNSADNNNKKERKTNKSWKERWHPRGSIHLRRQSKMRFLDFSSHIVTFKNFYFVLKCPKNL